MIKITISRRIVLMSVLFLALTVAATALAHTIGASSGAEAGRQIRNQSFHPQTLREMVQAHQLASTVQVLSSQPRRGLRNSVGTHGHVVLLASGCPESLERQHAERHHF